MGNGVIEKPERLLIYVTSSSARTGLMFHLLEAPRALTELRDLLDISSSNLIPRIKELKSRNLIINDDGKYRLTSTGMILAKNVQRMDNLNALLGENARFLNDHDLTPIPDYLICRMGEFGKCRIVENGINEVNAFGEVVDRILGPKSVFGILSVYSFQHSAHFLSAARQKIKISAILTEKVFERMESEHPNDLREYLQSDNARMYVISDAELALMGTDAFLMLLLRRNNGLLDTHACLVSFGESASKWGMELFDYYRQKSREIKEL